jgi:hypothetical protein
MSAVNAAIAAVCLFVALDGGYGSNMMFAASLFTALASIHYSIKEAKK